MDYEKRYKEETGKTVYMDLMGTACLTAGYVEWLKKECGKKDKKLMAIEGMVERELDFGNRKVDFDFDNWIGEWNDINGFEDFGMGKAKDFLFASLEEFLKWKRCVIRRLITGSK